MRIAFIRPGRPASPELAGSILARDLTVGSERWAKGRLLSPDDLTRVAGEPSRGRGPWALESARDRPVTVLILEPGDVHEDDAAIRLATVVAGPGVDVGAPAESRVDLRANTGGVLRIRRTILERLDRIDPVSVFTAYDGQVVGPRALVASVKVGPHVVSEAVLTRAESIARRAGPVVRVDSFVPRRIGVIVKETLSDNARVRFETSVRGKVAGVASELVRIAYVPDDPGVVSAEFGRFIRGTPGDRADIILTAGAGSTDPADAIFVAVERLGGRIVSHGVPAHPGSMLWIARIGRVTVVGMPTCGAYSKATAVDLVLPWLVAGAPASRATVARLGEGGLLTRDMRFRFPPYARELDAPEG